MRLGLGRRWREKDRDEIYMLRKTEKKNEIEERCEKESKGGERVRGRSGESL